MMVPIVFPEESTHMSKKYFPSFMLSLSLIGTLFLSPGCSDKEGPYIPLICTPALIIGELSEGNFQDPETKTPFSVALSNVIVKCSEDIAQEEEEFSLYVRMLVKRKTISRDNEIYKVPYFVVLSKGNQLILKEKLEADVVFGKQQKRITPVISSRLKIPLQKGSHVEDYTLYVGLQINESQLDLNYKKREDRVQIKKRRMPLRFK